MSNTWTIDVQNDIYTILMTRVKNRLVSTYPDIRFTMTDKENTEAHFPSVYIHFLPGTEIGQDTEGLNINGFICTLDFHVTVNSALGVNAVKEVAGAVMVALKEMRFTVNSIPEIDETSVSDTWRMIGRARRVIGQSDALT